MLENQPKVLAAVSKELAIVIAGAGVGWFKLLTTTVAEKKDLDFAVFSIKRIRSFSPQRLLREKFGSDLKLLDSPHHTIEFCSPSSAFFHFIGGLVFLYN